MSELLAVLDVVQTCLDEQLSITRASLEYHLVHLSRHHGNDHMSRVQLDRGSDKDFMFHEKGTTMHFRYITRQVTMSLPTSNES